MSSRRGKPQREVKQISKIGAWGNIRYEHLLECGHVELLPRASRSTAIACSSCGQPIQQRQSADVSVFDRVLPESILDFTDQASQDEIEIKRVQAAIASILGIPLEAISIVSSDAGGRLVIKSAYVFLSSSDIRKIIEKYGSA